MLQPQLKAQTGIGCGVYGQHMPHLGLVPEWVLQRVPETVLETALQLKCVVVGAQHRNTHLQEEPYPRYERDCTKRSRKIRRTRARRANQEPNRVELRRRQTWGWARSGGREGRRARSWRRSWPSKVSEEREIAKGDVMTMAQTEVKSHASLDASSI